MARLNIKSLQTVLASFIMGFALCNFLNSFHHLTNNNSDYNNEPTKNGNGDKSEISFDSHSVHHRQNDIISSSSSFSIKGSMQKQDNFCSMLSNNFNNSSSSSKNTIPSTISLWKQHIPSIFHSSKHGRDGEFIWHDYTAKLLNFITPQRLQKSLKNLPTSHNEWEQIGDIVDLAFRRWKYLEQQQNTKGKNHDKNNNNSIPRKVNILVMGGSVTMGVQCLHNPVQDTSRFARRDCAWPSRINQFLNIFLGYYPNDIFQIDVLTLGGTNTDTATTIWDYTLMPKDMPYPDIVIHGYATNDMHVLSSIEAQKRGITLEDMILDVNQKFIRQVLSPKVSTMSSAVPSSSSSSSTTTASSSSQQCYNRPPLLIYYDDYIGNEQHKIIETTAFSKAAHILSSYYDFPLISYADAVKDIVYTDTNEDWLSPHGWPERQVHPGMGMHIVSTWMIVYSLLHLATTYCSLNQSEDTVGVDKVVGNEIIDAKNEQNSKSILHTTTSMIPKEIDYKPTPQNGLPPLRKPEVKLSGEPKFYQSSSKSIDISTVLPPELNDSLTLDDISEKWNDAININYSNNEKDNKILPQCNIKDNTDMPRPCIYSWVGNLERKFDKAKHLKDRMQEVLISNNGWEAQDANNKLGYVATKAGATFEMELKNLDTMVQTLNFMYMKSYGEKWDGSKLHVDVSVIKKKKKKSSEEEGVVIEKYIEMTGFHDKNTSETYTSQLDLNHDDETTGNGHMKGIADKGDDLRVRFSLIGGNTFKMMGMAFCDH